LRAPFARRPQEVSVPPSITNLLPGWMVIETPLKSETIQFLISRVELLFISIFLQRLIFESQVVFLSIIKFEDVFKELTYVTLLNPVTAIVGFMVELTVSLKTISATPLTTNALPKIITSLLLSI